MFFGEGVFTMAVAKHALQQGDLSAFENFKVHLLASGTLVPLLDPNLLVRA